MFTPPRYSDLQPIELVWAAIKLAVGRQYDVNTTLADVRARLDKEFENLSSTTVQGCIDTANKFLAKILKLMRAQDDEEHDDTENPSETPRTAEDESDSESDNDSERFIFDEDNDDIVSDIAENYVDNPEFEEDED